MTPEQQKLIEQARLYAEHDDYAVTRTYIRGLLEIIERQAASVPEGWMRSQDEVNGLHKHLFERGWSQDWQCQDQACAMAAEVIEKVLMPMLAAAPEAPKL